MAKKVYVKDRDIFAGGNRAALAVLGAGPEFKSVLGLMDHDRRADLGAVTPVDERYGYVPKTADINVGVRTLRNVTTGKARILAREVPWAGRAVLTAPGAARDVDLVALLTALMRDLTLAASPFARSGRWGRSFRYHIGGTLYRGRPPADFTIGGVVNIAPYASALEAKRSHAVFQRTLRKWIARARREDFDVRMRYLLETAETDGKAFAYPAPIIEVGYLNSMRGRIGRQFRQRPRRRRR